MLKRLATVALVALAVCSFEFQDSTTWALKKHSAFTELFSHELNLLKETGVVDKIVRRQGPIPPNYENFFAVIKRPVINYYFYVAIGTLPRWLSVRGFCNGPIPTSFCPFLPTIERA